MTVVDYEADSAAALGDAPDYVAFLVEVSESSEDISS